MQRTDAKYIKSKKQIGEVALQIHGNPTKIVIEELILKIEKYPTLDFAFALVADSSTKPDEMLGFAGFYKEPLLLDVDPNFLELGMLKVDPKYFQNRIGATLLEYSKSIAKEREKKLIVRPVRPGRLEREEYRVKKYPMTEEQLRQMYIRYGFREFTPEEIEEYARRKTENYLDDHLWYEGIIPETREFTGKKRFDYPLKPEIKNRMRSIPYQEKIRLMKLLLEKEYGHSRAFDSNVRTHRRTVMEHLIFEE